VIRASLPVIALTADAVPRVISTEPVAEVPEIEALPGATESKLKPNAATVTSAMRLKVVFVDICFLSISQGQEFPGLGFG
jgi:phosphate starvation-inducible protein PhoH